MKNEIENELIIVDEGLQKAMDDLLRYRFGSFSASQLKVLTGIDEKFFNRTLNTSCSSCIKTCVEDIYKHNKRIEESSDDVAEEVETDQAEDSKEKEESVEVAETPEPTEELKTEFKGKEVFKKTELKKMPINKLKEIATAKQIEGDVDNLNKGQLVNLIAGHEK